MKKFNGKSHIFCKKSFVVDVTTAELSKYVGKQKKEGGFKKTGNIL